MKILCLAVRLVCATLWPCYASFKAIKTNDLATLERWLMFWVVLGVIEVGEGTVEWLINWFPFYYEIKSVIILWLTLPQIQGSTFIYLTYLHPFLLKHEEEIDAAVVEARGRARAAGLGYVKRALNASREAVLGAVLVSPIEPPIVTTAEPIKQAASTDEQPIQPTPATAPPPSMNDPASGPTAQAWSYANSFFRTYGPAALAAGSALLHPMQGRSAVPAPTDQETPTVAPLTTLASLPGNVAAASTGRSVSYSKAEVRIRRAALERELAEIEALSLSSTSAPASPDPSPQGRTADLRMSHSFVGGQPFEEIARDEAQALGLNPNAPHRRGWSLWSAPPPADTRQKTE